MLASITNEPISGQPEFLKQLSRWNTIVRLGIAALLLLALSLAARGQSAQSAVQAYADAIKESVIAQRITAMEHYLTVSSGGSLKRDALEFLVWDHLRLEHPAQARQHAQELLAIAPGNPLAIAVLNQDPPAPNLGRRALEARISMLRTAASDVEQLTKPEGMPQHNFDGLRRQLATMMSGALGLTYLQLQDYPEARQSLEQAVNSDPNNAQWVYSLGLALLNGKNRDEYRGHWYLARAANLTGQMPQGREIAEYARRKYKQDGGKDAGWQSFIASAAALNAPPPPAGEKAASTVTVAASSPAPDRNAAKKRSSAKVETVSSVDTVKDRHSKTKASFGFEDTLREPARTTTASAREPRGPRGLAAPNEAVSLGILIETSLLTGHNRPAIISTLKEIVHNLRANDEACILVFSDQLDFEQDLTADDALLEEALAQIKPRPGKALLSGISFAAGHLKRIGRNNNRILLVISDGAGKSAEADTLAFRSQVTGVRIDCIGLRPSGETERALLQRIAAYSGGKTSFASNPAEFRSATLEMTRNMGIEVRDGP